MQTYFNFKLHQQVKIHLICHLNSPSEGKRDLKRFAASSPGKSMGILVGLLVVTAWVEATGVAVVAVVGVGVGVVVGMARAGVVVAASPAGWMFSRLPTGRTRGMNREMNEFFFLLFCGEKIS